MMDIEKTLHINAPASKVWNTLTDPALMKLWVSDSEINITTTWEPGSPVVFCGNLHGIIYDSKGTVLQCEREKLLQYNFWTSLSQHEDVPENYSVITYRLIAVNDQTTLAFTQTNFVTEVSYKHFYFYWNVALELMKNLSEQ